MAFGATTTRLGLDGGSSMFWEFARVIDEMESAGPGVMLENVLVSPRLGAVRTCTRRSWSSTPSGIRATSLGGCPALRSSDPPPNVHRWPALVPQSASSAAMPTGPDGSGAYVRSTPRSREQRACMPARPMRHTGCVVERLPNDREWWDADRFVGSLARCPRFNPALRLFGDHSSLADGLSADRKAWPCGRSG